MKNETLNKEQFNCVEVPDFLYDSIKEKISYSKKSLLQGKSHHSHKELGKK